MEVWRTDPPTPRRGSGGDRQGAVDRSKGQSTVEFALVLPLVLLLLLGLLQVGLMLRDQLLVASAAREAAREAAVSKDTGRIEAAAARAAPNLDLEVRVNRGKRRGDAVGVVVRARTTPVPLVGQIVAGRRLTASATMRMERG